jgi:hypothetical protein
MDDLDVDDDSVDMQNPPQPLENINCDNKDDSTQSTVSQVSDLTAKTSCELIANTFLHSKRTKMKKLDMGKQSRIKYSVSSVTWKYHKFPNDDTFSNMTKGDQLHKHFEEVLRLYLNKDNRELTFGMKIAHWVEISGPMVEEVKRLRNEKNNTVKKKIIKGKMSHYNLLHEVVKLHVNTHTFI